MNKCVFVLCLQRKDEFGNPAEMLGPCLAIHSVRQNGSPMDTDSRSNRPDMYPGKLKLHKCLN